jgi:leader peptidase (prepilin peptidase)/N-methyltransferase
VVSLPLVVFCSLLGLAVGSFLNVCIDRLPAGESILRRSSHCASCGHSLAPLDLVPVLSFLWLRGRCRYCRAPIPVRLPLVELATDLLFGFLSWWYGPGAQLVFALAYASLLLVVFVIDLKHQLILDVVVYPGMALAVAGAFFWPEVGIVSALLGGAVGAALLAVLYLLARGGMGFGDVKLAGLIGLIVGYPLVFGSLLLGIVGGGMVAVLLLALRIKGRKEAIPFGPFLAGAALVTLVWGRALWDWYPLWPQP